MQDLRCFTGSRVAKLAVFVGVAALFGAVASASAAPRFQGEDGGRADVDHRKGALSPTSTQRTLARDRQADAKWNASAPYDR